MSEKSVVEVSRLRVPSTVREREAEQLLHEVRDLFDQYQREVPRKRKPWPESIKKRIAALWALGVGNHQIAMEAKLPVQTLYSWRQRIKAGRDPGFMQIAIAPRSPKKTFDELRDLRRTESKAILGELRAWMLSAAGRHLGESGIRKAINYAMKLWPELTRFAGDLSLPLSNNDAERALRHIVMGRKNFNGSKTINGADTAASIYTVIESVKKAGLQPRAYLKYLIEARWRREKPKTPHEYPR